LNPRDEHEYENDTITTDATDDSSNYIDTYDEKSGQSAIGRLFADNDEDDGYSPPKRTAPKTPVNSKMGDTDYYKQINATRAARGDRSRPAVPVSTATQKIERPVVRTNPEPKPAMKARVPVVREPIAARRVVEETDPYAPAIEDDVEHMKSRYSGGRDAIATAREPAQPMRGESDDRILHPVGVRTRPRSAPAPSEFEGVNPIRWIALAGVAVVLVLMLVLVFQNRGLNRELDDLRAEGGIASPAANGADAANPANGTDITHLEVQIASLQDSLDAARADLFTLENWVRGQGLNPVYAFEPPAPPHTPPPVAPEPPPEPPPPLYDVHYVLPGQNLSGIARQFYGNALLYPIIMEANNIARPQDLQINQRLIIPRLPE